VTHPAFGRRIKALEAWAGTPLVERNRIPVEFDAARRGLVKDRHAGRRADGAGAAPHSQLGNEADAVLRIATGRSLARTQVADWIARLRKKPRRILNDTTQVDIATGMMQDMASLLERGRVDLLCCYEHPALSVQLNPGRYRYMTLSTDKLVPVCQVDSREQARYDLQEKGQAVPLITYRGGLAMERIVGDCLETSSCALTPFVRCDSLDVAHGAVAKGLRVAWLPWSLVAADCRRGALAALGGISPPAPRPSTFPIAAFLPWLPI
jgi:LysR family transcriptional regulator, hypochlorite-specific transcription factor HypT